MANDLKLNEPWLVAVWPGMGNVALSAGYYLMAKLGMHVVGEFSSGEGFDVDHVEVSEGLVRIGRRPRCRLFLWKDPKQQHDILLFIGDAQPATGKFTFSRRLVDYAEKVGVARLFTFAAMATQMHPHQRSRVFGAATDAETLAELRHFDLEVLDDGQVGGLNGLLLGVAAESGLHGVCLLGEMPHILSQLPFPKASRAVLEVFTAIANIELDFSDLTEQVDAMEQKLGELLAKVERVFEQQIAADEEGYSPELTGEDDLTPENGERIESLFDQARRERSKAYDLKRELDRLGVFKEYEDRFLDLFKKPE